MKNRKVIIWNEHRKEYEVWYQSEVIAHSVSRDVLLRYYPDALVQS